ncbi:MAG: tetratricopeptide repeat protein [bacterium]|nr:MAG: tetratricopeptide repeat protein [bacterium]
MSYVKKRKSRKTGTGPVEVIADQRNLANWISEHVNTLVYAGGALLFVLFVFLGIAWMKSNRQEAASTSLGQAVAFYRFNLESIPSEDKALDSQKLEQALENFSDVAAQYPGTLQGQSANLFKANLLFQLGRYEEAAVAVEEVESRNPQFLADVNAGYLLARCYEAMGEYGKAIGAYSSVRDRAVGELRAVLSIDLARCSELTGDVQKAVSLYREVLDGFPDTVFALRAEKKLAVLGAADQKTL